MKPHMIDGILVTLLTGYITFILIYYWLYLGVQEATIDFLLWATGSLSDLIINFINK